MRLVKCTFLALVAVALFFTACEKDETPETIDSISGQLTAGENVTSDQLNGLSLFLCQFKNDGDLSNSGRNPSTYDILDIFELDEQGKFEFVNMSPGNYFIGMNEFSITTDTVYRFSFDGTKALNIEQAIDRIPADNGRTPYPPCTSYWVYIDLGNYSGPELTVIRCEGYVGSNLSVLVTRDLDFNITEGEIKLVFGSTSTYCGGGDEISPRYFIFGFADGNGGTLYSEKFESKNSSDQGSCVGLPQTVGQITISFIPETAYRAGDAKYVLSNN